MPDRSTNQDDAGNAALDGMPWRVVIAVILFAALFWLLMTREVPQPATHPAVGRPAPTLDLVQLIPGTPREGEEPAAEPPPGPLTLTGPPAAGAVTLLHFWGTWCPPCKLEYPELVAMAREMEAEAGFRFVTVSCGGGGAEDYDLLRDQTRRYYQSIDAGELETFADLDGQTRRSAAQELSDSIVYPTTILVSPDQRIAAVWLGYSPTGVSEMQQMIIGLLQPPR